MDSFVAADSVQRRLRRLTRGERREEAIVFIRQFARETGMAPADRQRRERAVTAELRRRGTYDHTAEELAFGARLAWRNHSRCIGRLWWKSLEVVDCRHVERPEDVAAHVFGHVRETGLNGSAKSRITVFAPASKDRTPPVVESPQVIHYAGYMDDQGQVLGDRQNQELTRAALSLGWRPPETRTAFDVLPLIVRGSDGTRHLFDLPQSIVREVAIQHPDRPEIGALGLKWYAVPCVSNMIMTIGGVDYPCAPFNGHYMSTEIASRDLTDTRRYDLLPVVAKAIGLDPDGDDPLWRDRALTELNAAVLHSFKGAGVAIVDHHGASAHFMEFVKNEQREGRQVSADWSWIVPPQAGSACPVFHLPMTDRKVVPNFFFSRALDGGDLRLDLSGERRGKWHRRYDRAKHRWRDWRRGREGLFRT